MNDQIILACNNTVQKAIEFESPELLKEAQAKMKSYLPANAKLFALEKQMEYCLGVKNKTVILMLV